MGKADDDGEGQRHSQILSQIFFLHRYSPDFSQESNRLSLSKHQDAQVNFVTGILLRGGNKQFAQLMQLIAAFRRLFEFEILRMLHHLPFQLVNFLLQRFRG